MNIWLARGHSKAGVQDFQFHQSYQPGKLAKFAEYLFLIHNFLKQLLPRFCRTAGQNCIYGTNYTRCYQNRTQRTKWNKAS